MYAYVLFFVMLSIYFRESIATDHPYLSKNSYKSAYSLFKKTGAVTIEEPEIINIDSNKLFSNSTDEVKIKIVKRKFGCLCTNIGQLAFGKEARELTEVES